MAGANGTITATERNELRKVVKGRFELLGKRLRRRKTDLEAQIRQDVIDATRDEAEAWEKKLAKESAKVTKAENTLIAAQKERSNLLEEAKRAGFAAKKLTSYTQYDERGNPIKGLTGELIPIDLNDKIRVEMEKIQSEARLAEEDLGLRQLELMEELAVGAVTSQSAIEFMGRIPDVDDVLPLPEVYRREISA